MDRSTHIPTTDLQEGSLGSYAHALRSHRALIALALVASLVGGLLLIAFRSPDYRATARILIDPASAEDELLIGLPLVRDAGDPTRTAQTAAGLLHSPAAAESTARQLGQPWTTRSVLQAVTVEPVGQSNILAVAGVADAPENATRLANTFATATLADRDAKLRDAIERSLGAEDGSAPPAPSAAARRARLDALRTSGDPTVSIADEALPPLSASGPSWWLVLALALTAGAVVGCGAAVIAEMRSPRRLAGEEQLLELVAEPILARLPHGWHRTGGWPGTHHPTAADAALRSLEVQLGLFDGGTRAIAVSSPAEDDGKTTLVARLARRLAADAQRVVVMDLDLHAPELAEALGVPNRPGLAAALAPNSSLAVALSPVPGAPEIEVLPGMRETRPAALAAARQRLPALIAEARAGGSHVLIDTAPLGTVGDAVPLLDDVDELLIVARVGHTGIAEIEAARDVLWHTGKTASGFVLIEEDLPVGTAAEWWSGLLGALRRPAQHTASEDDARDEVADEPAGPDIDYQPGDRVIWTRGAARGTGTIERRLAEGAARNGGSPDGGDTRYIVRTDRTGKELACRASALSRPSETA